MAGEFDSVDYISFWSNKQHSAHLSLMSSNRSLQERMRTPAWRGVKWYQTCNHRRDQTVKTVLRHDILSQKLTWFKNMMFAPQVIVNRRPGKWIDYWPNVDKMFMKMPKYIRFNRKRTLKSCSNAEKTYRFLNYLFQEFCVFLFLLA